MLRKDDIERGFTLIELLVVIAIIALLATVVMASLRSAQAKARDAIRIAGFREATTALQMYYQDHGSYPASPNTCCLETDHNNNFETVMNALISAGYLTDIPKAPTDDHPFMLYNYGVGNEVGYIFVTYLESIDATTVGPNNSCRPFTTNWCSYTQASKAYCLCHPY